MTISKCWATLVGILIVGILTVSPVCAGIIVVTGDPADCPVFSDGTVSSITSTIDIVHGSLSSKEVSAVLVFELPTLPAGEQVISANLDVTSAEWADTDGNPTLFNIDLYYLGWRTTAAVKTGDQSGGLLIMEDYIDIGDEVAVDGTVWSTNDTADGILAGAILAAYNAGAEAGDYVHFRVEPSDWTLPTTKNFNRIYSGNDLADQPELTIVTAVPEPSTFALLAAGLIGLLAYAWRKRR